MKVHKETTEIVEEEDSLSCGRKLTKGLAFSYLFIL